MQWTVVDVETSGMVPASDRVLSAAALAVDEAGRVVTEFSSLFNPGVDPGPVHLHGLTPARLAGCPRFSDRGGELAEVLAGRCLVAHNALFDVSFLAREYARAGEELPFAEFLCTLDLAGRLHLSTGDLKLGTLAAHFGVEQSAAHDAYDDALVLSGVLRELLAMADEKGVELPIRRVADMTADEISGYLRSRAFAEALAAPRPWRPAPRLRKGGTLVQGMELVFTQDVDVDPDELVGDVVAAGLYVAERISGTTSLAVCDSPGAVRGRAAFARKKGLELVTSQRLRELLADVQPGRNIGGRDEPEEQGALF